MHRTLPAFSALALAAGLALSSLVSGGGAAAAVAAPASAAAPASVLSAIPAADAGPSWSVAPAPAADGSRRANFDYQADPGATLEDAFTVRNNGATPLTLNVYAADAFTTREGNIDLFPAGKKSVDSGTWVALASSRVTVDPGKQTVIPFTVTVPKDARPGDHPTGIVTSLRSQDSGATVQVDRRLGARMQIRVSGELKPAVEISKPRVAFSGTWNPLATGTLDVSYDLTNTGNTRTTATAAVTAAGPLGVGTVALAGTSLPEVLPGSTITVHQRIPAAGALFWLGGTVTVSPESVGIGARALAPVTADFGTAAIPATPLLVLVVVAAAVVVVVVLLRRRRRRRRAAVAKS